MILRGAISGFGAVAVNAHLPGWQSRPDISIVAIHDPLAARRHHAIHLLKNIRVYDDLELMLDGESLDFLDIASPPVFHGPAAELALQAGVNVIVEKPLCLDGRELTRLLSLAAQNNRLLFCVHNWKYSHAYQRVNELIVSGVIGEVQYISLVRMRPGPAGSNAGSANHGKSWRLNPQMGGGILIDHGWHVFYLAQWLMGGEKPRFVSSYLRFNPNSRADELADIRLEFEEGRIGNVLLSWTAPTRLTTTRIVGTEGLLEVDGGKIVLADRLGECRNYSVPDDAADSYHAPWFVSAAADYEQLLRDGPHAELARINLDEASTTLASIDAARLSAAQDGRRVALNSR